MGDDPLLPLRTRFVARLGVDAARLRELAAVGGGDAEILSIIHKIAGIGGSLGFPDLSRVAIEIDCAHERSGPGAVAQDPRFLELLAMIVSISAGKARPQ